MNVYRNSKQGMTLIEVVVSLAILSLIAVFIISVFVSSMTIISGNAQLKKSSMDAAAGIENTMAGFSPDLNISIISKQNGTFTINFNEVIINANGEYITGSDKNGDAKYYYFNPN